MAQKWYVEVYKLAEKVGRTREIQMLSSAGELRLKSGVHLIGLTECTGQGNKHDYTEYVAWCDIAAPCSPVRLL